MKYSGIVLSAFLVLASAVTAFGNQNITVYKSSQNSVSLHSATGIALTRPLGLLIADSTKNVINVIFSTDIENYAGIFGEAGLEDARLNLALFNSPTDIAIDSNNNIYICDSGNNSIRKINVATGVVSTFIDSSAGLNRPNAIVFDKSDNLYISDTLNHSIKVANTKGNLSLFAGIDGEYGLKDGKFDEALFFEPCGLTIDSLGVVYVADSANHAIRKIENGNVTTVAGQSEFYNRTTGYPLGGYVDGSIYEARFNYPKDVVSYFGDLYVADTFNNVIRLISDNTVSTLIGNGAVGQDYNSIRNMKLNKPYALLVHSEFLYIVDSGNFSIIKLPIGSISPRLNRNDILTNLITFDKPTLYIGNIQIPQETSLLEQRGSAFYARTSTILNTLGYDVVWNEVAKTLTVYEDEQEITTLHHYGDFKLVNDISIVNVADLCNKLDLQLEWFLQNNLLSISR